jgi:hypothetical protein
MYRSTFSWSRLYPPRKSPQVSPEQEAGVGPKTGLDDAEKRKFSPLRGLELWPLGETWTLVPTYILRCVMIRGASYEDDDGPSCPKREARHSLTNWTTISIWRIARWSYVIQYLSICCIALTPTVQVRSVSCPESCIHQNTECTSQKTCCVSIIKKNG